MKTRVDSRLKAEAQHFRLRFTCEYCAYFKEESESCALEYPNAEHLRIELAEVSTVFFCKEFEHR